MALRTSFLAVRVYSSTGAVEISNAVTHVPCRECVGNGSTDRIGHVLGAPGRVNFATSMIDGRTVMETDEHSRSSEEIAGLWDDLEGRLEKYGSQWTAKFFNRVTRLIVGGAA